LHCCTSPSNYTRHQRFPQDLCTSPKAFEVLLGSIKSNISSAVRAFQYIVIFYFLTKLVIETTHLSLEPFVPFLDGHELSHLNFEHSILFLDILVLILERLMLA
jgi:hypothetical protein